MGKYGDNLPARQGMPASPSSYVPEFHAICTNAAFWLEQAYATQEIETLFFIVLEIKMCFV